MLKYVSKYIIVARFVVLYSIIRQVLTAPVPTTAPAPAAIIDQATLNFMEKYGYITLNGPGTGPAADTDLQAAIRSMQYMGQVPQTGVLDPATVKLFNTSRCSVNDVIGFSMAARRKKRYAVEGSKWPKLSLTYGYRNYTQKLSESVLRSAVAKAFQFWASASPLKFTESDLTADILLQYAAKAHGDSYPFDGPGGVLAHAFFPDSGGQAHFDEDESWTDGVSSGINYLQVATHEFGHALGLAHSGEPGAVMAPYYQGYNPNFQLGADDIAAIQFVYGAPSVATTTSTTTTTTKTQAPSISFPAVQPQTPQATTHSQSPQINICKNSTIDAIVVISQTTYVFKDIYYYVLDNYGIISGYPRLISSLWPEIQGKIDAVLYYDPVIQIDQYGNRRQIETGHVFFFQGTQYWRYDGVNKLNTDTTFPRNISLGFPLLPSNLDTAFIWSGNGRIYFTKGNQYYRYTRGVSVDAGYPRPLSVWTGIPSSGISAAFQWTNQRTYFFNQSQYQRFNDILFKVDAGYPRPTGIWWFGCSVNSGDLVQSPNLMNEYDEGENQFNVVTVGNHKSGGQRAFTSCQMRYTVLFTLVTLISWSFKITIS